jgi:hypothetical protein
MPGGKNVTEPHGCAGSTSLLSRIGQTRRGVENCTRVGAIFAEILPMRKSVGAFEYAGCHSEMAPCTPARLTRDDRERGPVTSVLSRMRSSCHLCSRWRYGGGSSILNELGRVVASQPATFSLFSCVFLANVINFATQLLPQTTISQAVLEMT